MVFVSAVYLEDQVGLSELLQTEGAFMQNWGLLFGALLLLIRILNEKSLFGEFANLELKLDLREWVDSTRDEVDDSPERQPSHYPIFQ